MCAGQSPTVLQPYDHHPRQVATAPDGLNFPRHPDAHPNRSCGSLARCFSLGYRTPDLAGTKRRGAPRKGRRRGCRSPLRERMHTNLERLRSTRRERLCAFECPRKGHLSPKLVCDTLLSLIGSWVHSTDCERLVAHPAYSPSQGGLARLCKP